MRTLTLGRLGEQRESSWYQGDLGNTLGLTVVLREGYHGTRIFPLFRAMEEP